MPVVHDFDTCVTKLQGGAVAIGENHTSPLARNFVIKLMDQGSVKILFMECFKASSATNKKTNEDLKSGTTAVNMAKIADKQAKYSNPVSYEDVVTSAVKNKVRIYGFDHTDDVLAADDPKRDTNMANLMFEVADIEDSTVGMLSLTGSSHLPALTAQARIPHQLKFA